MSTKTILKWCNILKLR